LQHEFNDTSAYNALWEQFYEQTDDISPELSVKNTLFTTEALQNKTMDSTINSNDLKAISNDIYIDEAYHIALDMKKLKLKL